MNEFLRLASKPLDLRESTVLPGSVLEHGALEVFPLELPHVNDS